MTNEQAEIDRLNLLTVKLMTALRAFVDAYDRGLDEDWDDATVADEFSTLAKKARTTLEAAE